MISTTNNTSIKEKIPAKSRPNHFHKETQKKVKIYTKMIPVPDITNLKGIEVSLSAWPRQHCRLDDVMARWDALFSAEKWNFVLGHAGHGATLVMKGHYA